METTTREITYQTESTETGHQVRGVAVTYGSYDIGPFTESISREAIGDLNKYDIRALKNHDSSQLLARSKFGEGTLSLDLEGGLNYRFTLPPTTVGKDTAIELQRGDISGSSWQFVIESDSWDFSGEKPHRTIEKISDIRDISLVTFPADPMSSAELRSFEKAKNEFELINIKDMAEEKNNPAANAPETRQAPEVKEPNAEQFVQRSDMGTAIPKSTVRSLNKFNPITLVNQLLNGKLEGLYGELNQEGLKEARSKNQNIETTKTAFHLPEAMQRESRDFIQRQQTVTGGSSGDEGGVLVAEEFSKWVNFLYPDTPVLNLCAKFDNLVGDQLYPKEDTVPSLGWGTEIAETDLQDNTYSTIPSKPERASIAMGYSNRLLAQEHSRGLQNRLFNTMNGAFNTGLEETLINGSGTGNQPTGILTALSASAITTGVLTHEKLIAFEAALADADALTDNANYVTSQKVRAWMKAILTNANASTYLAEGRLSMTLTSNGYPLFGTTVMPQFNTGTTESMIFGNFNDVSLDMWGSPILTVNPYTQMRNSVVELYMERQMNVVIHRAASFAIATDIVQA